MPTLGVGRRLWLPDLRFGFVLVGRGAVIWGGLRSVLYAKVGSPAISAPALVFLLASVAGIGLLAAWKAKETLFLANLGVGPGAVAALSCAPAVVAELLLLLLPLP